MQVYFRGQEDCGRADGIVLQMILFHCEHRDVVYFTVVVYVQDNVGRGVGLVIPLVGMVALLVLLLCGFSLYLHKACLGSPLTRLLQVMVAALHGCRLQLFVIAAFLGLLPIASSSKVLLFQCGVKGWSRDLVGKDAKTWSYGAHMFLQCCTDAGNVETAYTLGMVRLCYREAGVAPMAQAAMKPYAPALHSLAIIQFNGSGTTQKDKNLKNGASLCAKAAALAHVDAMRELGHCLQDENKVPKNVSKGRCLLLEANAQEAIAVVAASPRDYLETALHLAQSTWSSCLHNHR
ncbi:hypothetical protein L7F22_013755 [Adiantum nelumboides]|nr:hypothetical protein [Adiantum nelumboides]